ncbi:MAG: hypothetical protein HY225_01495 [Candidatus Vogelbacteria bacterium]|nr:hypothetical protein [Candidatus Vogelbacteria bacterium]
MKKKRDINKKSKKLSNEIITFYVAELTLAGIGNLTKKLELSGKELTTHDQATLNTLQTKTIRKIDQVFKWIREYLIYAVASELENQNSRPSKSYVKFPQFKYPKRCGAVDEVDKFLMYATEAEIRAYLKKATTRFNQKGWSAGFGGKKWGVIAKIALDMWSTDSIGDKCLLVDRTFQIEHNGGMIFDKRISRIVPDESNDKKVLNLKRRSKNIDNLLTEFQKRATNQETKALITKLVETLKTLEQSKKKDSLRGD